MPAPLAMPLIVTSRSPSRTRRVASFGKVSVVMMARAASSQPPGSPRAAQSESTPLNFAASSGSPMTPVEARNTSAGAQPAASAAISAVSLTASRPFRPVKALALPEFTTSAPRGAAAARWARHQSTGAEGQRERVNTPATLRAGPEPHEEHVRAAAVANAGFGSREPHALDRRQVGEVSGGERRDGMGHGVRLAFVRQASGHGSRSAGPAVSHRGGADKPGRTGGAVLGRNRLVPSAAGRAVIWHKARCRSPIGADTVVSHNCATQPSAKMLIRPEVLPSREVGRRLVPQEGFEPPTPSLR